MFAFVLLDRPQNIVIAARDHAGIKPLYYGKKGGDFYFSSEVRGLLAVDPGWPQNQRWPIWFLSFGFIPEPHTSLQNVWHLPKGHYLAYNLATSQYQVHAYEQLIFTDTINSYPEAVAAVRTGVLEAVNKHLLADVPVGIFLSGGIDSSILTLAARQMRPDQLRTLSIYFEDEAYSEKYYQDLVIHKTGVAHESYKVGQEEFTASLPDIYKAMDQPSTDGINSYFITRYAKEYGLKAVLSGLGADELFGGYPSFSRTAMVQKARRLHILSHLVPLITGKYPFKKSVFLREKRWYNDYLLNRGLFTPDDVADILGVDVKRVVEELATYPEIPDLPQLEARNRVSAWETDIYMQNQLLRDSDIYSMWHGVELRVPYLDKPLMQLTRRINPAIKFRKRPKQLLIDAFREELPEAVWRRPKQGFTFPFENWFRKIPAFHNYWHVPSRWQRKFRRKQINYSRIWAIFLSRSFGSSWTLNLYDQPRSPDTVFIYLAAFSKTGGIEKVNRTILKVLADGFTDRKVAQAYGVYDDFIDARYFPRYLFTGFSGDRVSFLWRLLTKPIPWKQVVVGHVNLAPAVHLLLWRKPGLQVTVMAHGIEVWSPLNRSKKRLLQRADKVISVSEYTKKQLIEVNGVKPERIVVQPNCLDPYYVPTVQERRPAYLKRRYHLEPGNKILLTVARLDSNEQYKGYDNVLTAIATLHKGRPELKYLLCGKTDKQELERINRLIDRLGIRDSVIMPGFIPDDELVDHYALADVFVMPSKKEGFGIVFIEAAACGTTVIAGNGDGSKEALLNGEIGTLVEPDDVDMLARAINTAIVTPHHKQALWEKVQHHYRFETYKEKMQHIFTTDLLSKNRS